MIRFLLVMAFLIRTMPFLAQAPLSLSVDEAALQDAQQRFAGRTFYASGKAHLLANPSTSKLMDQLDRENGSYRMHYRADSEAIRTIPGYRVVLNRQFFCDALVNDLQIYSDTPNDSRVEIEALTALKIVDVSPLNEVGEILFTYQRADGSKLYSMSEAAAITDCGKKRQFLRLNIPAELIDTVPKNITPKEREAIIHASPYIGMRSSLLPFALGAADHENDYGLHTSVQNVYWGGSLLIYVRGGRITNIQHFN